MADLAELVASHPGLYVRWSTGPDRDGDERSTDHATGLKLPGLAVNPLTPPTWWTLPLDVWVARQVRAYAHLSDDQPDHFAWVLAGRIAERGPDNEPLVVDVSRSHGSERRSYVRPPIANLDRRGMATTPLGARSGRGPGTRLGSGACLRAMKSRRVA